MSTTSSKPAHPPVSKMVITAIDQLGNHKGASLQAIKKYIQTNYNAEMDKRMIGAIGRYLKGAVEKGDLIHPKGIGANGSFKLSAAMLKPKKEPSKPKQSTAAAAEKKPKKVANATAAPKPAAPKAPKAKAATPTKKKAPAKAKVTVTAAKKAPQAKSPSMEKKVASPKPRKAPKAIKSPAKKAAKKAKA